MRHLSRRDAQRVRISPPESVERRSAQWQGLDAEVITLRQRIPFEYRFKADDHLLIVNEHAERDDGETSVEGLPRSSLRSLSGKLTFVPAGREFHGWQHPRVSARINYFYIDRQGPLLDDELRFAEIDFRPQMFFSDPDLWRLTGKLKDEAISGTIRLTHYGEALSVLLGHELVRINGATQPGPVVARGGLSGWQQKRVSEFIDAHLADDLRLSSLAALVDFSPYHFARAFKRSFGVPPHRYHVGRRIERAKTMLAEPASSVTDIALAIGFAETSSFSTTFRKATGLSPTQYRRSL